MAVYNGRRYLDEQVDSVLAQLHPDDELVVVDDASTDGSCDTFLAHPDRRVIVYRNAQNA